MVQATWQMCRWWCAAGTCRHTATSWRRTPPSLSACGSTPCPRQGPCHSVKADTEAANALPAIEVPCVYAML